MGKVEKATVKIGSSLSSIGSKMTIGLTAPLLGAGAASIAFSEKMDDAMDNIRSITGKTGPALDELGKSFEKVFTTVPVGADQASEAIAKLAQRTGQTGVPLEKLSTQVLNVSRLLREDLNGVIESSTRVFGDWGVSMEKQDATMDMLFKTSQETGIGFATLGEKLVQFGAPLRQMGFGIEESAALLGKFEKEGVNAELVLSSLRIGLGNFAKQGKDAPAALQETITSIKSMASASDATALAMKIFGAKAGPDMAAAIREGRFSIEELLVKLRDSGGAINGAAKDTDGFKESLIKMRNQLNLALKPLGVALVEALEKMQPQILAAADAIGRITKAFADLSPGTQKFIFAATGVVFVLGPVLGLLGNLMTLLPVLKLAWFGLVASVTAITLPVFAASAALASVALATIAVVKNFDIIKYEVGVLVDRIRDALVGRFTAIVDSVKQKVEAVTGFFADMYDKVVGNSYVPDMVTGIADEFAKLDAVMVQPARDAADKVNEAFAGIKLPEILGGLAGGDIFKIKTGTEGGRETEPGALAGMGIFDQIGAYLGIFGAGLRATAAEVEFARENLKGFQRVVFEVGLRLGQFVGALNTFSAGLLGKIASMFNPLTIVSSMLDEAFRKAAVSMEPFMGAVTEIAGILMAALKPVLDALVPVFASFVPVIRALAPIIGAVGQIFAALMKAVAPILMALVPLLRALFPVFKFLAIVTTYVGQIFAKAGQIIFTIASFLARAIGSVIKGIGTAIDKIPGLGDFGMKKAGQGLIDLGESFGDTAKGFGEAFTALGDAREEIKGITLADPAAEASSAITGLSDAAKDATSSLRGITAPVSVTADPGGMATNMVEQPATTGRGGVTLQVEQQHFYGVQDPDEMYRQVGKRARVEARRGGVTDLQVALG